MKKILLFDIDKTIFDTDKLSNSFNQNIAKVLGTTDINRINAIKEKYRKTLSNPREYVPEVSLKLIADDFRFKDVNKLIEIYSGKNYEYLYSDAVYPESFEVLEKLKEQYRLGIYSEGTGVFQNHKFQSMGIQKYFDKELIFIVDAKDNQKTLAKIPKGAIIVDDKERICEYLTQNGIKAIWLNRKNEKVNKKFITIHNLIELSGVV